MQREHLLCISQETVGDKVGGRAKHDKVGGRAKHGSVSGEAGIVSVLPLIAPLQC